MIRLGILKSTGPAGDAVRLIAEDAGVFEVVLVDSCTAPSKSLSRDVALAAPELILIDVGNWPATLELVTQLKGASRDAVLLGYRGLCTPEEEAAMLEAGIAAVLRAPFGPGELDSSARRELRLKRPLDHPNILAFLPSKAGSGCSTVVLNTAAVLANDLGLRTLLIEGDRRSGVLSMVLGVEDKGGLPAILAQCGKLTPVEWRQHVATIGKLDMLLANPLKPGPQPTWATYFQILDFVKAQYDFILVDLPELINPATAELACAARSVFVVCEPELASLKLVGVRRGELEAAGVHAEVISVVGNRWEGKRLTKDALEKSAQVPMYAAMPNDYLNVKNAVMESRLVSTDSAFGRACVELARRVCSLQAPAEGRLGSLLRKFGRG
jgi:Flp pilus assembly CpaE family ATPase